jgi:signal transduction histidine kinase
VPQLAQLSIAETVARIVRAHERRTGTRVVVTIGEVPDQAPLPVKITLYRAIQEALSNAYRHAGGLDQQVHVGCADDTLHIEGADGGPGFVGEPSSNGIEHLGLIGMRERVESLGGQFHINNRSGQGTTVIAELALHIAEDRDG